MIKTAVSQEGFEGIFFPVNEETEKVVIVISGSNGGMKLTKKCAEFYYKNGISALVVALFNTKGTQKNLDRVPIEYIESAIKFLKNKGYRKIGIDGLSKGSELALLASSMFQDLSCVIARVPSHFISEGLVFKGKLKIPSGTSCWSYRGKEVPYAKYNKRNFNISHMMIKAKEMNLYTINKDKNVTAETYIPIEKINAPILLLSSIQDTIWPSYESCLYMEKYLKEKLFAYPYKHIAYKNISHMMFTEIGLIYKLAFKSERNNLKACAEERKNLKAELLNWVKQIW